MDGELSATERVEVERHLAGCEGCRGEVERLRALLAEAGRLPREIEPDRDLFPAIREGEPHTTVVAPGFSCRQQIGHFTEADAVSAIERLESLVRSP